MSVDEKAFAAKRLLDDEAFQDAFKEVRESQIGTFLSTAATLEAREMAHTIICALDEIETVLKRRITDLEFEKDQHRGSD
jgi:hypothetical protein